MAEIYEKGQVVLPKHMREALKMYPGMKVAFRMEQNGILVQPTQGWLDEFHSLCSEADMTSKELREAIKASREKRRKEMLNVPGLEYLHKRQP
jgi:AbrB family looped-hinge helix DNA binding protein